jgi:nucleotidyltransferase/DNA polymerase involved in DNA repair
MSLLGGAASSSRDRRVIMHCDMDCFYAQVERERFPHWKGLPISVIQNGALSVTTNYRVRTRGFPKMGAPEGMQAAPAIKFAGSNMTRYRAASKAWYAVFSSFPGVVVMKKSIDESYCDLTAACLQRIKEGKIQRVVRQSPSERARIDQLPSVRYAAATAAWQLEDASMLRKAIQPD